MVQCQGVLASKRRCGPNEEQAQRSEEPGCVCQNDSTKARDLTPLTPRFSTSPQMALPVALRGCSGAGSSMERWLLWDNLQGKVLSILFHL